MQITFGKHNGKSVELLMLKEPGYIHWLIRQSPSSALLMIKQHAQSLMKKFDAKPLNRACHGRYCTAPATRVTVYGNSLAPYWWCDNCDPYQAGANNGKLQALQTYTQALRHVEFYCAERKSDYIAIIKCLAGAKGLPTRVGEKQANDFFA